MGRPDHAELDILRSGLARLAKLALVLDHLHALGLFLRLKGRRNALPSARPRESLHVMREELARILPFVDFRRSPSVIVTKAIPNAGANAHGIFLNSEWIEHTTREICQLDETCRRALLRGVAAHELSHHVRAQKSGTSDPHVEELTADALAGYLLARTDTDLRPYLALVGAGAADGSASHPPPHLRVAATRAAAASCCRTCTDNKSGAR